MTLHKDYPLASFKALPGEGEGTFEAVVSVIGNVDLQGDRVMSGAFDKTRQKWIDSGNPLPVLWSHDWGDPFAHIGYVDPKDMKEIKGNQKAGIPAGLYVKGHLDVHKPFAKQVYDLLSERRVTEFSFSYDIPPGGESRGKDGANELSTVDLIEVGPTLKGANPMTVSLGTKSDPPATEDERRVKVRLDHAADAELRMAIEKASWNGDAAMRACHTAADFRKIAFERANDSDPDTAAHWALPHHSSPGADANPAGVAAALAALHGARGGAPDLKNKDAAESHLKAHQGAEKAAKPESADAEKDGNAGNASSLIRWFNEGAGGAIAWGSPGDWSQCVAVASAHMGVEDAKGFCQNRHQEATGMSTAEHAHQEGKEYDTPDGLKFDPNQIRDRNGRWTDSGGGGTGAGAGGGVGGISVGAHVRTPDGTGTVTQHGGGEGADAWYFVEDDESGIEDEYHANQLTVLSQPSAPTGSSGHITESGGYSTGTPGQEAEAEAIIDEMLGSGLLDEDTLDAVADPTHGFFDALKDLVSGGHVSQDTVDEVRRGLPKPKKSAKAGRMIGASAAQTIKEHVMSALDECFKELNGSGDYSEEKLADAVLAKLGDTFEQQAEVRRIPDPDAKLREQIEELGQMPQPEPIPAPDPEPGKKEYARGYADGNMGRARAEEVGAEYGVGYQAGEKDRAESDRAEIAKLEELFSSLEKK